MSGAYIQVLPPDRPIFMVGQPIIRLVAGGTPGEALGDISAGVSVLPGPLDRVPAWVWLGMAGWFLYATHAGVPVIPRSLRRIF